MGSSSKAREGFARLLGRLLVVAGFCVTGLAVFAAPPLIDVSVVPLYVGEEVTVEALVKAGRREANVVRLEVGHAPTAVDVVLVEGLLSRFPPHAEEYFVGKTIRASGRVREFRGKWEIVVRDPQNIAAVLSSGRGTAALPTKESTVQASPGVPAPDWQQKYAELQTRLQLLEARLEALQSPPAPMVPSAAAGIEQICEERLRKVEFRLRQLERKIEGRE
ncbi:MAG: hypothetical protein N3C12_06890 [Candidatus Binatia bacterium]|nr:hypothetical protein [Candidatus Binatia bacterium]